MQFQTCGGLKMPLERVSKILGLADKEKTAVIGFNSIGYDMVYSIIHVADKMRKPAIVTLYPDHYTQLNASTPNEFAGIVKDLASHTQVPIGLHLDHCSDLSLIIECIRAGFTSVMYDGSSLPIEENIRNTKMVVEIAHAFGVDVESELGHIGLAADDADKNCDNFTDPDMAKYFCNQTKVDSIAISIGNAHGLYKGIPQIDFERLMAINDATETYLVLHGGTGIPHDQLTNAFTKGINKLNVGTEFFQTYYNAIRDYVNINGSSGEVFGMPMFVQERLCEYLFGKMSLCELSLSII